MMYAHLSILLPPALSSHILYQAGQSGVGPRGDNHRRGGGQEFLLTDRAYGRKYITVDKKQNIFSTNVFETWNIINWE